MCLVLQKRQILSFVIKRWYKSIYSGFVLSNSLFFLSNLCFEGQSFIQMDTDHTVLFNALLLGTALKKRSAAF